MSAKAVPHLVEVSRTSNQANDGSTDAEVVYIEGYKPVIPDGVYEAKFVGHETAIVFGGAKLFLHFEVVQAGEYFGTCLFRPFRIRRLKGRPRKNGGFVAHAQGDLFAVVSRLLDVHVRRDRISLDALRHMLFRVTTRTVTRNSRQQDLPEAVRYSVISSIERGE